MSTLGKKLVIPLDFVVGYLNVNAFFFFDRIKFSK